MRNSLPRLVAAAAGGLRSLRIDKWSALSVAAAMLASLAAVLLTTQFESFSVRADPSRYAVGRVAEKDYVVERNFTYVDERATQLKRDARETLVPPVYALNDEITLDALAKLDRFIQSVGGLVSQGASEDKVFLKVQIDFPGRFTRADLRLILSDRSLQRAFVASRSLLDSALSRGIVDMEARRDEIMTAGAIELWRIREGKIQTEEVPVEAALTRDNLVSQMQPMILDGGSDETERRIMSLLLSAFGVQNAFYSQENTLIHRNRARAEVEPVTEKLVQGQVLARRGDIISESAAQKIQALSEYSLTVDVNSVVGSTLFLAVTFGLAIYLLNLKSPDLHIRRSQTMLLLGLGLVHLIAAALAVRFLQLPGWLPLSVVIPTSALSVLVAILVSPHVAVFFSLAVSLALMLLTGLGAQPFLFSFLSGLAGTAVVLKAEKRIDLVKAGLLLSLADDLILAILGLFSNLEPSLFFTLLGWGALNGFFCGILSLGFLPIFEHLLNAPTRFKLMELSDLNSPIFKRMLSQAPGTYSHSISVANLAETACEAIGANALLARVSAYYHDIGKVDQADYFVENQKAYNRHDEMKPSLSVAVIKSHVRIGIEKARELKLPKAIIDIIAQHHGRGLIRYFYHRAVSEGKNPRVSRDDYSYPGVRPRTKEAAVLMLADSVEAASRTLKKPTEAKLERFVWDLIMDKFQSDELGESNLTFRDLELIRRSFVRILEGYYHTRIEYPKLAEASRLKAKRSLQGGRAKEPGGEA